MKLEAVNSTQIETVLAMLKARAYLIDRILSRHLQKDDDKDVDETLVDAPARSCTTTPSRSSSSVT